jgi:K+-sensing histidine kinase KdpD
MALMKGTGKRSDDQRQFRTQENRIAGMLNFLVLLSVAAVGYTDWMVVPNITLGYLYVLPIALSGLVNPLPFTLGAAVVCTILQDIFAAQTDSLQVRIIRDVITLAGFLIVGFVVTRIARQRNRLVAEVRRSVPGLTSAAAGSAQTSCLCFA